MVDIVLLSLLGLLCIAIIITCVWLTILTCHFFNSLKEFEYDYVTGFPKDFTLQQGVHNIQTPFAFKLKGQDVDYTKGYIKIDTYHLLDVDDSFNKKMFCRKRMMRFFDEQGKEIDPENITHYAPLKISWKDYHKNKFQSA